jgi:hypothetical protein
MPLQQSAVSSNNNTHPHFEVALDADDGVEDALTVLANVTEKCDNLRSDLRKDLLRAVSNLRKEFAKLRSEVGDKMKTIWVGK